LYLGDSGFVKVLGAILFQKGKIIRKKFLFPAFPALTNPFPGAMIQATILYKCVDKDAQASAKEFAAKRERAPWAESACSGAGLPCQRFAYRLGASADPGWGFPAG